MPGPYGKFPSLEKNAEFDAFDAYADLDKEVRKRFTLQTLTSQAGGIKTPKG